MKDLITTESSQATLQTIAAEVLALAKSHGATSAEVNISDEKGFSVSVRQGDVDTVIYNKDKQLDITVYFGHKTGSASTTDIRKPALQEIVAAACTIAKYSDEDPCGGLADKERMCSYFPDLDLYHPWAITPNRAIEMALDCEKQALACDKRLVNSDGAFLETHQGCYVYANTHGFNHVFPVTGHALGCSLIAKQGNDMQRDGESTYALDYRDLKTMEEVAQKAAARTITRLGSRKLATQKAPVIFISEEAAGLIGLFVSAISGGSLYRKSTFLVDSLGEPVFQDFVHIHEQPLIKKGLASSSYDNDGVATQAKDFVKGGVVESYVLGSYSARQLKMQTTGNAGGVFNLTVDPHDMSLKALLKEMDKGFLVTELMGQGINLVTGDYSRGAAGFWVEHGEIQFPVHEVTIAGNLRQMFKGITKIANDIDSKNTIRVGSLLIDEMMIAGD